ncbi:helix-turn-helix transcriptional regulator [Corynebacterium sp. TA-R-1]|uniref:Helix-turn-helix transcriptional regulator n=1 Tax=Corynebacterium stercoris TaxID=2943490 RepID=A0ABT1G156_9CORY|nr:helix-turn-helix transcriptional regulator [Corynebacterium stercoris]MCP1387701.1 helix-turn-helix transcriptional regulator [Corynebacterium stercoris]
MTPAQLGEIIRAERRARGLTQLDLAELAEVSDRFVRELEKGKATAELGKTMAVFAVLGFDLVPVVHQGERAWQ